MNWADFLNSDSDAVVWLGWYPTLWLLNAGGGPLQLCFLFILQNVVTVALKMNASFIEEKIDWILSYNEW